MPLSRTATFATAIALSLLVPQAAWADKVVANCTGMLDFDIYTIDTELTSQEIEPIGEAEVAIDEDFIVLTGAFGEYKFDRNAGTLYHNDRDTSVYCTYSTKQE